MTTSVGLYFGERIRPTLKGQTTHWVGDSPPGTKIRLYYSPDKESDGVEARRQNTDIKPALSVLFFGY